MKVLTLAEWGRWDEAVRAIPGWDVYWLPGYGRFWERNGDGTACLALLEDGVERVALTFVRRPIPETDRWDMITPYGYGGHLATAGATGLIPRFYAELAEWARSEGGVSAFIRFHPVLRNHETWPQPPIRRSETVWLDLAGEEPEAGFKAEVRNRIRKATRAGLTCRFTPAPPAMEAFLDLFHRTMDRLGASGYYHFADEAFAGLLREMPEHLLLGEVIAPDGAVAAAALFLYNDWYLHYHLGGSDPAWLRWAPNNLLFAEAARWGRERGRRLLHLGGGVKPTDELFRFKSGFSRLRAEFCVGQLVLDPAAYDALTDRHVARLGGRPPAPDWFPAYRAPAAPTQVETLHMKGAQV
ncbi:MAG TPA: GNAT family N-acetyltransferase [Symbiobacteriaceae bacterium]|nr:GNAT family N-acetyltransferase [Symbiobacteriaceae bacterium]